MHKVLAVSGIRSEYDILYPVINELEVASSQELYKDFVLTRDIAFGFPRYMACKSGHGFEFEKARHRRGFRLSCRWLWLLPNAD